MTAVRLFNRLADYVVPRIGTACSAALLSIGIEAGVVNTIEVGLIAALGIATDLLSARLKARFSRPAL